MRALLRLSACTVAALATEARSSRLLLVRHGETNFNADGRLQGRLESELTEKGHAQATMLGEWFQAIGESSSVDRVFVSPRLRTRQTLANLEAKTSGLPPAEVRPGLREIELTMWEGQYRSKLQDAHGNSDAARWEQWKAHPASFVFAEDGHSPLGDLTQRAAEEWASLRANTPAGSTSLVVAHGAFNRVFMMTALGLPVDDFGFQDDHFDFENCATVELRWTAGASHAAEWRKRYPEESPWITRQAETDRRRAALSSHGGGKTEL